jgi:hypothetical protein
MLQELSCDEVAQVSGGKLTIDIGLGLIGAIGGAAMFIGAPAAAAFAAGVALGGFLVEAFD